jgi:hypothetical protein
MGRWPSIRLGWEYRRMNMPMREDESLLWLSFGLNAEHDTPRSAGRALGIAPRRVEYLCEKWARKGWYDYGVAHDLGWKVTAHESTD